MKPNKNFGVQFSYLLHENMSIKLKANVELKNSEPHYEVTNIVHAGGKNDTPLVPGITIKGLRKDDGSITWVHTDSEEETILSNLIGKEIEKTQFLETIND
jgi:hypothetical protein